MDKAPLNRLDFTQEKIKNFFTNRNLWYLVGIACGTVTVAYVSQLLFKQVNHFIFFIFLTVH